MRSRHGGAPIVGRSGTPHKGAQAEEAAARHLMQHGLAVIARNFRCRGGEIDLICEDGGTVVFVEVRLRSGSRFGGAASSITGFKRRRLILAARHWLANRPDTVCRFDAVLLDGSGGIEWLKNAFDAS